MLDTNGGDQPKALTGFTKYLCQKHIKMEEKHCTL